jgi:hypothetical protein
MLLHHGTTRQRAEAILKNGPDANYREENSQAEGFFVVPAGLIPDDEAGSAASYAHAKAKNEDFSNEGGPAIVEIELPDDQVSAIVGREGELVPGKALNARLEIAFQPDGGLEELVALWPTLKKRVLLIAE